MPSKTKSNTPNARSTNAPRRLGPVRRALRDARGRAKLMLLAHATGLLIGGAVAALAVAGLIDFFLRFPSAFRWLILASLLALLALWLLKELLPAIKFRPRLSVLALRLEKLDKHAEQAAARGEKADRAGGLDGLLTSALELERDRHDPGPMTADLRAETTERALAAFKKSHAIRRLVRPAAGWRGAGMAVGGFAVALTLLIAFPTASSTGLARTLTPWRDVRWPSRTDVEPVALAEVHPSDRALPIRAVLLKPTANPERTEVVARYRIIENGRRSEERRVVLAAQSADAAALDGRRGRLFERLIEPGAFESDAGAERVVEIALETEDDQTRTRRVRVVDPPALASASASVTPPQYAQGLLAGTSFVGGEIDLGDGQDERGVIGPILEGSMISLDLAFTKPLAASDGNPAWLDPLLASGQFTVEHSEAAIAVRGIVARSARLAVSVEGIDGLTSREEAVFAFDVAADQVATAAVTEPARDERVLATAVVDLLGEGRDDLALERVWLLQQIARPPAGSVGAAPELASEDDEGVVIAERTFDVMSGEPERAATLTTALDLSTLDVDPGDEVWITALAADVYDPRETSRDPGRSAIRVLRIIGEAELIEQIRNQLQSVRRAAIRLDEQQADVEQAARRVASDSEEDLSEQEQTEQRDAAREAQAGLGERLGVQLEALQQLQERRERNGLEDEALEGLLDDAERMLAEAGEQSNRAAEQLGEAQQNAEQGRDEEQRSAEQQASEAQSEVRDQLGSLVRLLDRGEDGWLVRRSVERLLEDQRELAEDTERLGAETLGQSTDDLTERQLSDLEKIAQRQRELAERAEQALDELSERAQQMQQADPAQASAMQQAASAGREAQVPQKLEEASEQIQNNQTTSARQQQDEAIDALEQALEELDNAARNRDRELQRQAADLAESLEQLVKAQRDELTRLDLAKGGANINLAAGMIELNGNTLGVAAEAAEMQFEELDRIAGLLDEALKAQTTAITFLRQGPPDLVGAEEDERTSLAKLQEALEIAKQAQEDAQQREQDRAKRELQQAYRDALEQQLALRGETETFVGRDLARRERGEVRGIGTRQQTLQEQLQEALGATEGLEDAIVFELAHEQLDGLMGAAGAALRRGRATDTVVQTQSRAIEVLISLIESLRDDQQQPEDEFSEGGGGGGGGGGSGQPDALIENIQQLKLLRSLQKQVADLTRLVDESGESRVGSIDPESLGNMQQRIADTARDLIEQIREQQQEQQGGNAPPAPPGGQP